MNKVLLLTIIIILFILGYLILWGLHAPINFRDKNSREFPIAQQERPRISDNSKR